MAHHGAPYASCAFLYLTCSSAFQADSLDRKFEKPLRHHLDGYKNVVAVSILFDLATTNFHTEDRTGAFNIL